MDEGDLNVVAVLSGNRNFEGRIHPQVRASYLASPPLCVAYALAGRVDVDLTTEPIGHGRRTGRSSSATSGRRPRRWSRRSARRSPGAVRATSTGGSSKATSTGVRSPSPSGPMYAWDPASTYVQEPPFFHDLGPRRCRRDIEGARVLVKVGDSITTDHISPAGAIKAGLAGRGVPHGARRRAARLQLVRRRAAGTTR